jgi:hypothetical protein
MRFGGIEYLRDCFTAQGVVHLFAQGDNFG